MTVPNHQSTMSSRSEKSDLTAGTLTESMERLSQNGRSHSRKWTLRRARSSSNSKSADDILECGLSEQACQERSNSLKQVQSSISADISEVEEKRSRSVSRTRDQKPGSSGFWQKDGYIRSTWTSTSVLLGLCITFSYVLGRWDAHWAFAIGLACACMWGVYRRRVRLMRRIAIDERRKARRKAIITDSESVEWLNVFLEKYWYFYESQLSKGLRETLGGTMNEFKPAFVSNFNFKTFSLGDMAPQIKNMRCIQRDTFGQSISRKRVVLDCDASFLAPRADLILQIKTVIGFTLPVAITDVVCTGVLRVELELVDEPIHIKTISVCFKEEVPPEIDFSLAPLSSINLMDVPGLAGWIRGSIMATVEDTMIEPERLTIPIMEDKDAAENQAMYALGVLIISVGGVHWKHRNKGDSVSYQLRLKLGQQKLYSGFKQGGPAGVHFDHTEEFGFLISKTSLRQSIDIAILEKHRKSPIVQGRITLQDLIKNGQQSVSRDARPLMVDMSGDFRLSYEVLTDQDKRKSQQSVERQELTRRSTNSEFDHQNERANVYDHYNRKERESPLGAIATPMTPSVPASIFVTIHDGAHLPAMDLNGKSDPYVVVKANQKIVMKTRTVKETLFPKFNESFEILADDLSDVTLNFECYDRDDIGSDDFMGMVHLPLLQLVEEQNFVSGHRVLELKVSSDVRKRSQGARDRPTLTVSVVVRPFHRESHFATIIDSRYTHKGSKNAGTDDDHSGAFSKVGQAANKVSAGTGRVAGGFGKAILKTLSVPGHLGKKLGNVLSGNDDARISHVDSPLEVAEKMDHSGILHITYDSHEVGENLAVQTYQYYLQVMCDESMMGTISLDEKAKPITLVVPDEEKSQVTLRLLASRENASKLNQAVMFYPATLPKVTQYGGPDGGQEQLNFSKSNALSATSLTNYLAGSDLDKTGEPLEDCVTVSLNLEYTACVDMEEHEKEALGEEVLRLLPRRSSLYSAAQSSHRSTSPRSQISGESIAERNEDDNDGKDDGNHAALMDVNSRETRSISNKFRQTIFRNKSPTSNGKVKSPKRKSSSVSDRGMYSAGLSEETPGGTLIIQRGKELVKKEGDSVYLKILQGKKTLQKSMVTGPNQSGEYVFNTKVKIPRHDHGQIMVEVYRHHSVRREERICGTLVDFLEQMIEDGDKAQEIKLDKEAALLMMQYIPDM
eukprot:Clim_evm93s210 gene=Clim_evmTU93s210